MNRFFSGLLLATLTAAAPDAGLRITIRLVHADAITGRLRQAGERAAERILGSAGVELVWVDCGGTTPGPCGKNLEPGEFWLHIVTGEPPRTLPDAAGFAVLYPTIWGRDGYAGVFYRKVIEIAASEECDAGYTLGATMAHEIGHLLLASNRHSARGVMRARFNRADVVQAGRGDLRFTPEQTEAIQRAWGCDNSPNGCRIPKS